MKIKKLTVIFLTILFLFSSVMPAFAASSDQEQTKVIRLSVVNVTTTAGTPPVLPSSVTAAMSDGTTKSVDVKWAVVNNRSYGKAYIVTGTIAESSTIKAIATVRVADARSVPAPTIKQVQQDILGTWKTSDGKYILEFHDDGTLTETVQCTGYTANYNDQYSFSNANWIKITNYDRVESDHFVLKGDTLTIYNLGISRFNSTASNFPNTDAFLHPDFAHSSDSINYVFIKVE